jgi:hypothetical protein
MMPFVQVLLALRKELTLALDGKTHRGDPILVRHARHRESRSDERPCVSIVVVSPADISQDQRQTTGDGNPELVMELGVNIAIDLDLQAESDDPLDESGDPTGFGDASAIIAWILDWLYPDPEEGGEENNLGGTCWMIRYDGSAPDDGTLSPDLARMEERLTILYRVRGDHPTKLLTES